jgi:25S rRNA (uracil2634-N3)-methyltransferase
VPDGLYGSEKLPPNQRPEACPRSKGSIYDGLYTSNDRVLTLGDGDFSFSLSVARGVELFDGGCLIATSHESKETILSTYPLSLEILNNLKKCGVKTMHNVDATNLLLTEFLKDKIFDFIVWNFPCVRASGGADGQATEIEENKSLLRRFFHSASKYLDERGGQLHIAHKTIEPFSWWGIEGLAEECGYISCGTIVFDR